MNEYIRSVNNGMNCRGLGEGSELSQQSGVCFGQLEELIISLTAIIIIFIILLGWPKFIPVFP